MQLMKVDHEMFILICCVETLRMRRINIGVHRVCQIKFTHDVRKEVVIAFFLHKIRRIMNGKEMTIC